MALKRNETYPGRFSNPTSAHPQGAFKNRTAPGSQDGSYLEQQWANDWDGFFGSLLTSAGITPDGNVDAVGASQYFKGLLRLTTGVVGDARNAMVNQPSAATSLTYQATELIVEDSSGGQYRLKNISVPVSISTTGAGGLDTGTVPTSGFVAVYVIYNPTTLTVNTLAVNATNAAATDIYSGSNMPSGYTASALVSVWKVASSLLVQGVQRGRKHLFPETVVYTSTTTQPSLTSLNISSAIPRNAKSTSGFMFANAATAASNCNWRVASDSQGFGSQTFGCNNSGVLGSFTDVPVITTQTIFYLWTTSTAALSASIGIYDYTI